jgi:hypothetical protein
MKTDNKTIPMTVEDRKQIEAVNFTFRFRNTLSRVRHTF